MSDIAWHAAGPAEVARNYGTDPAEGLTEAEAVRRRGEHEYNRLPEAQREPRWHAFLRQFQDLLILTLIGAALVSLLVTGEWETPAIIVLVVLLNATIGFVQESKAEASLEALQKMLHTEATVLRDGSAIRLDAADLVPGDIVELEAGARVPADGRLLSSASLEVQEAALTGEAEATAKSAEAEVAPDAPLADRVTSVFMNTIVTRGHARMIVTATGAATEIGQIAGLIQETEPAPTPLQRQINALGKTLALIAGVVIVIVFVLGLLRGQPVGDLFITSVSLAVATVPEGLPAVVAFTLAMGTARLARRGAIVKRLASVETLGSTSQICTDKTGTLTLNQMTAREVRLADRRFTVSGQGYSAEGRIRSTDDSPAEGRRSTRRWSAWRSAPTRWSTARTTWSVIRPSSRWSCWRRRAGWTSPRSGDGIRASPRCRSTPTTSSWPSFTRPATGCAASSRARPTCSPPAPTGT